MKVVNNKITTTTTGSALDTTQGKVLNDSITPPITNKGVIRALDDSFSRMGSNTKNLSRGTVKIDNKIITEGISLSTIKFSNGGVIIPYISGYMKYIRSPQSDVSKSDNYDGCYINAYGVIYERKKDFSLSYICRTGVDIYPNDLTRYKGDWYCIGKSCNNIINMHSDQIIEVSDVYSLYSYKDLLYALTKNGLCSYDGSSLNLLYEATVEWGELVEWNGYIYLFIRKSYSSRIGYIQRYDPSTGLITNITECDFRSKFFIISDSLYYGYRSEYSNCMYSVDGNKPYQISPQADLLNGTYWNDGFITYDYFYPMNSTMYIKN